MEDETTKDRIDTFSPYRVESKRGTWFVKGYVFLDGIIIHPSGKVTGGGDMDEFKREIALRTKAGAYASRFVNALYRGKTDVPNAGDCLMCRMHVRDRGADHIISHMEENYYVPSLMMNALEEFGASIAMKQTALAFMNWNGPKIKTLADALEEEPQKPKGAYSTDRNDFIAKQIAKTIRRYILRQLGVAT